MAFGTIRQTEYDDPRGVRYRLTIYKDGYSGSTDSIELASPGALVRYDYSGQRDIYSPLVSSSLSFTIVAVSQSDETFIDSLATNSEGSFIVLLERKPSGGSYSTQWAGTVLNDLTSVEYADRPLTATVQATDDLPYISKFDLHELGYSESVIFETIDFATLFGLILGKVRYTSLLESTSTYKFSVGLSCPDINGAASNRLLQLFVNTNGLKVEGREFGVTVYNSPNIREVLESLLRNLNARLFQFGGRWVIQDVTQLITDSSSISPYFYRISSNAGIQGAAEALLAGQLSNTNYEKTLSNAEILDGSSRGFVQPFRKVTRSQEYDGDVSVVFQSALGESFTYLDQTFTPSRTWGDDCTDGNFEYPAGVEFRLRFSIPIFWTAQATSGTAANRFTRIKVRLTIQVGNQYWTRGVGDEGENWYGYDTDENAPDPGVLYTHGSETALGSWSTSEGYWEYITEPFDRGENGPHGTISIDLPSPPLPTDEQGITITPELREVTYTGSTFVEGALNLSYGDFVAAPFQLGFNQNFGPQGDALEFVATGDSAASEVESHSVLFGDVISNVATRTILYRNTSNEIVRNESTWTTTGTSGGGLGLNLLGVLDIAKHRKSVRRAVEFKLFRSDISPENAVKLDSTVYVLSGYELNTGAGITSIEAVHASRDLTGITTAEGEPSKGFVNFQNPGPGVAPGPRVTQGVGAAAGKLAAITLNGSGEITELTVASNTTVLDATNVSNLPSGGGLSAADQAKLDAITTTPGGQINDIDAYGKVLTADNIEDASSSHKFATSGQLAAIANNTSALTEIQAVFKENSGGSGGGLFVNPSSETESLVKVTSTESKIQAGANTAILIQESSPGSMELNVQAGTAGNEAQVTAITISGSSVVNNMATVNVQGGDFRVSSPWQFSQGGAFSGPSNTVTFGGSTSGIDYNDLSNTPTLATVATSGSHSDLSNRPPKFHGILLDGSGTGDLVGSGSISFGVSDILANTTSNLDGVWMCTTAVTINRATSESQAAGNFLAEITKFQQIASPGDLSLADLDSSSGSDSFTDTLATFAITGTTSVTLQCSTAILLIGPVSNIGAFTSTGAIRGASLGVSNQYTLPTSDGTSGQALTTDGSGNVSFTTISGGGGGGYSGPIPLANISGRWTWSSADDGERVLTGASTYGPFNWYSHSSEPSNTTIRRYSASHTVDSTSGTMSSFYLMSYGIKIPTTDKKVRINYSFRLGNASSGSSWGVSCWGGSPGTSGETGIRTITLRGESPDETTSSTSTTAHYFGSFTTNSAITEDFILVMMENRSGSLSRTTYLYGQFQVLLVD